MTVVGLVARPLIAAAAVAIAVTLVSAGLVGEYWRFLLTEMAILSLLAMSFNIVYGYGGMLSFCQGTFYGLGAYIVAWLSLGEAGHPLLILLVSVVLVGLAAAVVGLIIVRMDSHNLTIATVILAVVSFLAANSLRELTGGEDGLPFSLTDGRLLPLSDDPHVQKITLALAALYAVLVLLWLVARSTSGKIIVAVRENELRARFLGYNVRLWRLTAFVAGGAVAGLAGGLYALAVGHVSTTSLEIGLSVNAILWAVVGGVGTLVGPVVGVALLVPLTDYLSSTLATLAQIPVGVLLILVITVIPDGIVGSLRRAWLERHLETLPRRDAVADRQGGV